MNARFRVLAPKRLVGLTRFKSFAGETRRPFCSANKNEPRNGCEKDKDKDKAELESRLAHYEESYRQLDNLDFMTAAKIVFTEPPSKRKFGIDFHLVQLFFALMPSLAVYLVAQYARYEMRKMEAVLEQKKKKEDEEEKAKELELNAAAEKKEAGAVAELLEVKTRLNKLEEAVKEIAVESKKQSSNGVGKEHETGDKKKQLAGTEPSSRGSTSESGKSINKDPLNGRNSAEEKGQGSASVSSSPR